ncbi:MAG: hypothetical protein MUE85_03275 [Microscillaceae bacterium]|jgi:hypothetical protein|nr:hypothetical protein [Microscillaceae bacterium]
MLGYIAITILLFGLVLLGAVAPVYLYRQLFMNPNKNEPNNKFLNFLLFILGGGLFGLFGLVGLIGIYQIWFFEYPLIKTEDYAQTMFVNYDKNQDNKIDIKTEYEYRPKGSKYTKNKKWLFEKANSNQDTVLTLLELKEAIKIYDKDGDGYLNNEPAFWKQIIYKSTINEIKLFDY